MEFTNPTTKTQMYSTLKEIYDYYRFQPVDYSEEELMDLNLPRMQYDMPTDAILTASATTALAAKHHREVAEYKKGITQAIAQTEMEINNLDAELTALIQVINNQYDQSISKSETEAVKKGIAYSDIVQERITFLENERNSKILSVTSQTEEKRVTLQAKLNNLNAELLDAENYFAPIHQKEIIAKADELKLDGEKIAREVFEYNNGLLKREVEYANSLVKTRAGLEIQYMEIRAKGLAREELVKMGYYTDVVNCTKAYYDTLDPMIAYNDILGETEVIQYLQDFYQDLVFVYRTRAFDSQTP